MRTSRTRLAAVAAIAVLGIAVAAGETSAAGRASTVPPDEGPVGAACADIPTDGTADAGAATAIAGIPDLSTFALALEEAGLSAALDLEGPFTVFVPNDAAFAKIPQNVLDSIIADSALLNSILVYHVVSGAALAPADLMMAGAVETAHGAPLAVTQDGETIAINGGEATVLCGGIAVANGYLYVIDSVLQPPSGDVGADGSTSVASSTPDATAVANSTP